MHFATTIPGDNPAIVGECTTPDSAPCEGRECLHAFEVPDLHRVVPGSETAHRPSRETATPFKEALQISRRLESLEQHLRSHFGGSFASGQSREARVDSNL